MNRRLFLLAALVVAAVFVASGCGVYISKDRFVGIGNPDPSRFKPAGDTTATPSGESWVGEGWTQVDSCEGLDPDEWECRCIEVPGAGATYTVGEIQDLLDSGKVELKQLNPRKYNPSAWTITGAPVVPGGITPEQAKAKYFPDSKYPAIVAKNPTPFTPEGGMYGMKGGRIHLYRHGYVPTQIGKTIRGNPLHLILQLHDIEAGEDGWRFYLRAWVIKECGNNFPVPEEFYLELPPKEGPPAVVCKARKKIAREQRDREVKVERCGPTPGPAPRPGHTKPESDPANPGPGPAARPSPFADNGQQPVGGGTGVPGVDDNPKTGDDNPGFSAVRSESSGNGGGGGASSNGGSNSTGGGGGSSTSSGGGTSSGGNGSSTGGAAASGGTSGASGPSGRPGS